MVMKRIKKHGVKFTAYLGAFVLLKASWWIGATFGSPTLEQIIFHLQNGADGLEDADLGIFYNFTIHVVALPFLFATILFGIQQFLLAPRGVSFAERYRTSNKNLYRWLAYILSFLQAGFVRYIPIGLLIFSALVIANKVALWSYLQNHEVSEFIDQNYVAPKNITAPKNKLNLVLIYVESLEKGYSDAGVMGRDLLADLNDATKTGYRFGSLLQTTGTGWTMAGIVSSQCGIPLKSTSLFNVAAQKEKEKSFLPHAICLGDILYDNGYRNVFMGGASLYFAAKGSFFSQHGYAETYGKEDWVRNGASNFNEWGLYDDELFANARIKVDQLHRTKQPFNLTLLTVDTHPPSGYISPTCERYGGTSYRDTVSCSATMVADFIEYMRHKGYLKNTVVVVMGDHLSMQAPLDPELKKSGQRSIYNAFLIPTKQEKNRDTIYHFGIFPSILYAMEFRFRDNRLGLGASGFGKLDPDFPIPALRLETLNELLAKTSRKYLEFMGVGHHYDDLKQKDQKY